QCLFGDTGGRGLRVGAGEHGGDGEGKTAHGRLHEREDREHTPAVFAGTVLEVTGYAVIASPVGRQLGRIAKLHGEAARRVRHGDVPNAGARRADEGERSTDG